MYKLQKQAKQIRDELKNIHIEAESDGVTVVINGEQHVLEVKIAENAVMEPHRLAKAFMEATNKAVKKAQQISAEKMKAVMGDMGM